MYQSYATTIGLAESLYQGHLIVLPHIPHICRHREEDPPIKDNFHICNLQKRTLPPPPPSPPTDICNLHFLPRTFSHYFATSKRGQPPPLYQGKFSPSKEDNPTIFTSTRGQPPYQVLPRTIFTSKRGQPPIKDLQKRTPPPPPPPPPPPQCHAPFHCRVIMGAIKITFVYMLMEMIS